MRLKKRIDFNKFGRQFRLSENDRRKNRIGDISENAALKEFGNALESGDIGIHDVSIRGLFEAVVDDGYEAVRSWDPRSEGMSSRVMLCENEINTAAFKNISGQIVFTAAMQEWQNPQLIGDKLCTTVPTQFDGEKIPGITDLGDVFQAVTEGKKYPTAGVGEMWIETPNTVKRGIIVPLTKEAIFFDRTGILTRKAGDVARYFAINKEKRILDAALGITTLYRRNGSAADATYGDTHTSGTFDNLVATNALVDYTDIENALLAFDAITDPTTGEPIDIQATQLVVPTALKITAMRILNTVEVRTDSDKVITAGAPVGPFEIVSNQYVKARTSSASTWFIGDFKRAIAYMENWGMQTSQQGAGSDAEFERDIVMQFKLTERGAPAVLEPRYVVKCTA